MTNWLLKVDWIVKNIDCFLNTSTSIYSDILAPSNGIFCFCDKFVSSMFDIKRYDEMNTKAKTKHLWMMTHQLKWLGIGFSHLGRTLNHLWFLFFALTNLEYWNKSINKISINCSSDLKRLNFIIYCSRDISQKWLYGKNPCFSIVNDQLVQLWHSKSIIACSDCFEQYRMETHNTRGETKFLHLSLCLSLALTHLLDNSDWP